jgi:hypothetical protein
MAGKDPGDPIVLKIKVDKLTTSMGRIERMQAPLIYSELPSQKQQKDH